MGTSEEDFEEIRHLGQGAFGEVVLARRSDGVLCAVKRLRRTDMTAGEEKEHIAEIRALQTLDHPGILRYYGSMVSQDQDRLSLIMEFADSGDLQQLMKRRADAGRDFFEPMALLAIFAQLAAAVAHVHHHHVMHRDLKPSNVLLTSAGFVKLGDFGVAKVMAGTTVQDQMTCVGSPTYMAPEIVGGEPYGRACDVWSLGVILYELCSFKRPFEGRSLGELIMRVASGQYTALSGRISGPASESLVAMATPFLDRMLTVDSKARATMPDLVKTPPLDLLVLSMQATAATVAAVLKDDSVEAAALGSSKKGRSEDNPTTAKRDSPYRPAAKAAASRQPAAPVGAPRDVNLTQDSFALSVTGASEVPRSSNPSASVSFSLTPASTVKGAAPPGAAVAPSATLPAGQSTIVAEPADQRTLTAGQSTIVAEPADQHTLGQETIATGAPGGEPDSDSSGSRADLRDILKGAYHTDDELADGPAQATVALEPQETAQLDPRVAAPLEPPAAEPRRQPRGQQAKGPSATSGLRRVRPDSSAGDDAGYAQEQWSGRDSSGGVAVSWNVRSVQRVEPRRPARERELEGHSQSNSNSSSGRSGNRGGTPQRGSAPQSGGQPDMLRKPIFRSASSGSADDVLSMAMQGSIHGSAQPKKDALVHAGSLSVLARPQRNAPQFGDDMEKSFTCPPGEPMVVVAPRPAPPGKHLLRATTPPAGRPSTPEVDRVRRSQREKERAAERERLRAAGGGVMTIPFFDKPDGSPTPGPPQRVIDTLSMHDERQKQRRTAAATAPAASFEGHGPGKGRSASSSSKRSSERGGEVAMLHAAPLSGARPRSIGAAPSPHQRR